MSAGMWYIQASYLSYPNPCAHSKMLMKKNTLQQLRKRESSRGMNVRLSSSGFAMYTLQYLRKNRAPELSYGFGAGVDHFSFMPRKRGVNRHC